MFSSLLVLSLAAIAPLAHANVFITNPVASTNIPAGKAFTITWQDDGKAPNLTAFGPATIGLYVGSQSQQTQLQPIGNVDVSKVSSISWTPDATVGPDFDSYFIRITSVDLKDATQTQFNAEAFSAKFTLSGMSGPAFNATIQAEISGAATGSGAASTAPAASGASTHPSGTSASAASTVKPSPAAGSSAASSAKNGAGHMVVPRVLGATGVAAIVFAFFL